MTYGQTKAPQGFCFYVMDRMGDAWVRVSELYSDRKEAHQAYKRLRKVYPFARLGGSKVD